MADEKGSKANEDEEDEEVIDLLKDEVKSMKESIEKLTENLQNAKGKIETFISKADEDSLADMDNEIINMTNTMEELLTIAIDYLAKTVADKNELKEIEDNVAALNEALMKPIEEVKSVLEDQNEA
ncbi:MAG: hypothetical protein ARM1_0017 [Candidatus Micrarchaeota archaeon]|nr:MAG: hypothetical protein ARM1_0017 [Candidatus Micrarchaeota archaeon]